MANRTLPTIQLGVDAVSIATNRTILSKLLEEVDAERRGIAALIAANQAMCTHRWGNNSTCTNCGLVSNQSYYDR